MATEVAAAPAHHPADADGYRTDGGWQARRYNILLVEELPPAGRQSPAAPRQDRLPGYLRLPAMNGIDDMWLGRRQRKRGQVLAALIETADGVAERPNAIPALLALTRLVGRALASEHMLQRVGGSVGRLLVDWEDLAGRYGSRPSTAMVSACGWDWIP
jgi:hypothetical protein